METYWVEGAGVDNSLVGANGVVWVKDVDYPYPGVNEYYFWLLKLFKLKDWVLFLYLSSAMGFNNIKW